MKRIILILLALLLLLLSCDDNFDDTMDKECMTKNLWVLGLSDVDNDINPETPEVEIYIEKGKIQSTKEELSELTFAHFVMTINWTLNDSNIKENGAIVIPPDKADRIRKLLKIFYTELTSKERQMFLERSKDIIIFLQMKSKKIGPK